MVKLLYSLDTVIEEGIRTLTTEIFNDYYIICLIFFLLLSLFVILVALRFNHLGTMRYHSDFRECNLVLRCATIAAHYNDSFAHRFRRCWQRRSY